jgi:2-oxoglutarate ferredoxin oxidoreductase subunit alpha
VIECQEQLAREYGIPTDYCRVRAYPFSEEVAEFVRRHRRVYVVEQNRDAQLVGLLRLSLTGEEISRLRSVLHYNGLPIDARSITDSIMTQEVAS